MSSPEDCSPASSEIDLPLENKSETTFLVGIAGGASSGKTEVCESIMKSVMNGMSPETGQNIVLISQESFYRNLTTEEQGQSDKGMFNFDHPNAVDFDLMITSLSDIKINIQ